MSAQSRKHLLDPFGIFGLLVLGQILVGVLFSLPLRPLPGGDDYISVAAKFPDLTGTEWGYGGYTALLALGEFLGSGAWLAFAIQAFAALAAGLSLLALGRRFGGEVAGWIAAAIYLLHPLVAQWTRHLTTESLFYSGVILVSWCLVQSIDNKLPWSIPWIVVLATATIRPNGILLVGAVATVTALTRSRLMTTRLLLVGVAWGAVLLISLISPTLSIASESNRFGPRAWLGEVVHDVEAERIDMPEPEVRDPSNIAFLGYVLEHPLDMAELGARRVWWELKQVRPWYSRSLNAYTAVSMVNFYLFAAVGAWRTRRSSLTILVTCVSLPFMALISLTWAIWEGRFGWWFLVLWTVWAGIGAQTLIHNLSRRRRDREGEVTRGSR